MSHIIGPGPVVHNQAAVHMNSMIMGQVTQSRIIMPAPAVIAEVVQELAKAPPADLKKLVNIAQDFQKQRITVEQLGEQVEATPYRSLGSIIKEYRSDVYAIIVIILAALAYFHPNATAATTKEIEQIVEHVIQDMEQHHQQSVVSPPPAPQPSPTKSGPSSIKPSSHPDTKLPPARQR